MRTNHPFESCQPVVPDWGPSISKLRSVLKKESKIHWTGPIVLFIVYDIEK